MKKIKLDENGKEKYYNDKNELHREDGPALIEHWNIAEGWVYKKEKFELFLNIARKLLPHKFPTPIKNQEWYKNGKKHRIDGPAVISINGTKEEWWFEGKRHREGGPAIVLKQNNHYYECWYSHDIQHRENGPSMIIKDDKIYKEEWRFNGKLHNEAGPAFIEKTMNETTMKFEILEQWFLYDKEVLEEEFKNFVFKKKLEKELLSKESQYEKKLKI